MHIYINTRKFRETKRENQNKCTICKKWLHINSFRFSRIDFQTFTELEKLTCFNCEKYNPRLLCFKNLSKNDMERFTINFYKAFCKYAEVRGSDNFELSMRNYKYRTPKDISIEEIKRIKTIYILSVHNSFRFNMSYEVDHITPLNGKDIKGVHNYWNLQIIPKILNRAKSNLIVENHLTKADIDKWFEISRSDYFSLEYLYPSVSIYNNKKTYPKHIGYSFSRKKNTQVYRHKQDKKVIQTHSDIKTQKARLLKRYEV